MTDLGRAGRRILAGAAFLSLLAATAPFAKSEALVLAATWQPAFCETRPEKPECRSQTAARFDASHFTLHGLWPQPRGRAYCGVARNDKRADKAGRWAALPALDLEAATRAALERVMPGTRSFLHRHEWLKHGTCYASSAERYLRDSLSLMVQLNGSGVRAFFAERIGQRITADQIRARFAAAFGPGAGRRVKLVCKSDGGRRLIVELRINLEGPVTPARDLAILIAAAPTTPPGCEAGLVDPVGLQ